MIGALEKFRSLSLLKSLLWVPIAMQLHFLILSFPNPNKIDKLPKFCGYA